MKKKLNRSLLLIFLVVFMCTSLTGCATKDTDVSNVEVSFDNRTITVSSPKTNTFKLTLEIEANSTTSSWTSKNLCVAGGVPHTYNLEDLMGDYISENAQITSVNVEAGTVTNYFEIGVNLFAIGLIIGFILGLCKK